MVRAYFRATLLFEDVTDHDRVIRSQDLYARRTSEPLNYYQLGSKYMPKDPDYQFLSPLQRSFNNENDSSFTPGSTEVIYVRPAHHQTSHSDNSLNPNDDHSVSEGTIKVSYRVNTGDQANPQWMTINSVKRLGRVGQPFHRSDYLNIQRLPRGYQLAKLNHGPIIHGNQVTEFKAAPQNFDIAVIKQKNHNRMNQVTGNLLYKDKRTGKIQKIVKIHGPQDSKIRYDLYKKSKYIPSGYQYDGLDPTTGHFLEPNASYMLLIKKIPKKVSARIIYKDIDHDSIKRVTPINGVEGSLVDFHHYTSNDNIPKGYHFVKLDSDINRKFSANATYSIYIKMDHQIKLVTARVLYQDINSNQIKLSKVIKGRLNQSISEYTDKNSRYIPNGYHFVNMVSNHGSKLKPNAVYIVLMKRNQQRPQVTGKIVYKDIDTNHILDVISIKGLLRSSINYRHYTNSDLIPNGYSYVKLSSNNDKYLEPNMKYVILVKSDNKSNKSDSSYNSNRSGANLPQMGHSTKDIGSILMALGSSLSALGNALGHHRI